MFGPTHMWIGQEARSESAYESEYEMKLNLTRVDSNRQKFVARLLSAVHVFSWLGAPVKCIYFTLFSTFIGILHFFVDFVQAKSATEVAGNQHFCCY